MEVGAVKQAFNNEVIHLKKKLNQAKTQTIHKLTRKAKTLTEKKAPEKVQAKLKRKAVSAVQEVLLIKKITAKDIARFAVTHKGELNSYLNRPTVDNDKACARLLLHKTLEDKYKFLRETFTDLAIDDLLMSREERKKMKKEAKEKSKKKKGNSSSNSVNTEGDWTIEDVDMDSIKDVSNSDDVNDKNEDERSSENETENCKPEHKQSDVELKSTERQCPIKEKLNISPVSNSDSKPNNESELRILKERVKKVANKKQNDNSKKSKKITDKFLSKRINKAVEVPLEENKIADPFFVTSSGESYMSLVEPRLPDEVKDVHIEGNRRLRRAAMFGHAPKLKPRKDYATFRNQNSFKDKPDHRKNHSGLNFEAEKKGKFERRSENESKSETPEKLHPSWEAKKRQSGLIPFKGKKIVFEL